MVWSQGRVFAAKQERRLPRRFIARLHCVVTVVLASYKVLEALVLKSRLERAELLVVGEKCGVCKIWRPSSSENCKC